MVEGNYKSAWTEEYKIQNVLLFADGDGAAEKGNLYAYEDSQWLFACGYYE